MIDTSIKRVDKVRKNRQERASVYLKALESIGVLKEMKVGRETLFIHPNFVRLLISDDHPVPPYSATPTVMQV